MVNLLYYHGMSQIEAAAVLGVSDKTVRRRWQRARLALADALDTGTTSRGFA
jgi:DNA-directed RNA polymerase specialized sigma24 family protein